MSILDTATVSQTPASRTLRTLRGWIRDGQWAPGDRLPAETSLAERLEVSRPTLRQALRKLQDEGLLLELPGRGHKARGRMVARSIDGGEGLMSRTVGLLTEVGGTLPHDPMREGRGAKETAVDAGIVQAIHEAGLHIIQLNIRAIRDQDFRELTKERPRGIIATHFITKSSEGQSILQRLSAEGLPVVAVGNSDGLSAYDRVLSDHEAGAHELTRWLLARGHRRMIEVGSEDPECYWVQARSAGYKHAMSEAGLPQLERISVGPLLPQDGSRQRFEHRVRQIAGFLVEPLLGAEPVDAIMAQNDVDALLVAAACRLLGKRPNEDVGVVGYDNFWATNVEAQWEAVRPLATVDKQNSQIGIEAVNLLLERSAHRLPEGPQTRQVAPKLVIPDQAS